LQAGKSNVTFVPFHLWDETIARLSGMW
jgi:hypothetical protein